MNISELPTIDRMWTEYDWTQAFNLSQPVNAGGIVIETYGHIAPEIIQEVLHFDANSPDGYGSIDFYTVLRLVDGRYAAGEAGCDTTGWGCQGDYAWWKIALTYEEAVAELSTKYRQAIKQADERLDN